MKAIRFKQCDQCQDKSKSCNACFGIKNFYFSNNNFFYWDKKINRSSILVRELRFFLDLIINAALIAATIFSVVLIYRILNSVEFDPRNFLDFLISPSRNNFTLLILLVLDMYLFYRLSLPAQKRDLQAKRLKDTSKFTRYNFAESLNQETEMILDRAWLYALHKKVWPVTVWHLLFVLLNDKDIRVVLARLGVGSKNLQEIIDKNLASLVDKNNNNSLSRKEKLDLSFELKEVILNAYWHSSVVRKDQYIKEIDLLAGLVALSQDIKDFFYDFEIDDDKIDNVIAWIGINLRLAERYRRYRGRSAFKPKTGINRGYTAIATPLLDSFSADLTQASRFGRLPLSVAREAEIAEVMSTMESDLASVVLVGPNGVGKTNIIEGISNRMMAEEVPAIFQDKRLVSISLPMLVSGASESGRLEERFLGILNEVAISGNIILAIDNIHNLVGISSAGREGVDLSEVLAAEIRNKKVLLIASTNNQDYVKYLEGSELGQALRKINIEEPNKNQAIQIMEANVSWLENKYKIYFTYNALEKIYQLTDRYLPDMYLPTKALNIMEEIAVRVSKSGRQDMLVRAEDVAELISHKTQIPLTQVSDQESVKLLNLAEEMHQRIVGQDEAVQKVATALQRARAELRDQSRPIANFLFLGPTGVGKTELAKTVAEKYFGAEENMIRLDMSEYQNKDSLDRLLGSNTQSTPGILTEAVRHKPFALLLLDEIEKAHPDILNVFLQVMEDGRLTDALGRTVDFTNVIMVATSNAGTEYIQQQIEAGQKIEDFQEDLIKTKLQGIFRPEFLNRFDSVVVFRPLNESEILQIAGLMLNKVKNRLEAKGIYFEITESAQKELAQLGFDPVFGARSLRRVIQEKVDNALAKFLLQGKIGRRDVVVYDQGGEISIKKAATYQK
ncbi:ATP-dependent Clp protease ATP-binding subunit [Candidatus Nomurabacteria bacterium]|nr:ATP-dependent Clp protease ATP-binding subunit [Candidatus Nomurabacteria bacterium]